MEEKEKIDATFELIQRLAPSEKSFISKKIKQSNTHKNHYVLLEIISKNNSGTEEEIKRKFEKTSHSKFYTVIKSQLQDIILRFLADLSESKNVEVRLFGKIIEAEILLKKSLNKQASKILMQVIKEASKYELSHLKIRALDLLINTNIKFEPKLKLGDLQSQLTTEITNYQKYAEILRKRIDLNEFNYEITDKNTKEKGYLLIKERIEKINPKELNYFKSQNLLSFTLGLLEIRYNQDFLKAAKIYSNAVRDIEKHPHLIAFNIEIYLSALHNLAFCYNVLNDEKNFYATIEKITSSKGKDEHDETKILERYIMNVQAYLIRRNRYKEVVDLIDKKEKEIFLYANLMQPALCLAIMTNCVISNLLIGNYKQCVKWNNYVLNNKFFVHYNLQAMIKVFNLLVHYELGHFDLVESLIPGTNRFLAAHNCNYGAFKISVRYLQKLLLDLSKESTDKTLKSFKEEVEKAEITRDINETEFKEIILEWLSKRTDH